MATLFTLGSPIPGLSAAGADPGVQPYATVTGNAFDKSGPLYNQYNSSHILGNYSVYIYPNYTTQRISYSVYAGPVSTSSVVSIVLTNSSGVVIKSDSSSSPAGDNDMSNSVAASLSSNTRYYFEVIVQMGTVGGAKGYGKITYSGSFIRNGSTTTWTY